MPTIDKASARKQQIAALKAYPQAKRERETEQLVRNLLASPEWQAAESIACTISGPFEVATSGVIAAAQTAGKTVYLPKVMPKRQMAFMPHPGDDRLIRSKFGLLEPAYDQALVNQQPDLVVVPGLAYELSSGKRLGFGGGYYDRFLSQYQGATFALALPPQVFATAFWPTESFDVPLQHIITLD
ncbi:5-formyltetrahydrofolate cyclo-ligase [Lacticaseibacillus zhaodongensis]|uniref:5-formyltetrahydrofolate cyclo-ligase n=1 Tax=Lacticaseibacillus zhaodongensis TaxID=2668065 RepID=UPI001E3771CA|nr:5-formyltetrahydrofolate cyclo-ligase [Lacticaseibacillus zhaodongensis]